MTFDSALAMSLNEKYRADALRVFVTGAKKSLSDILFAKGPKDLPTALALAQEVESNHERYQFALIYSKNIGDRGQKTEQGSGTCWVCASIKKTNEWQCKVYRAKTAEDQLLTS